MRAPAVPEDYVITLSTADVTNIFRQVNIHKAAGPDGLSGRVLRASADQLASLFTDIFNISLSESVIPTCFKQTTIVPCPRILTCLNDYRHVALTFLAMKCFERLVMTQINTIIPETLDQSNLHTVSTDIQMMQSELHSTLPFPTWTKGKTTGEVGSLHTP